MICETTELVMLKHLDLVDHIVTFTFMQRTENKLRSTLGYEIPILF